MNTDGTSEDIDTPDLGQLRAEVELLELQIRKIEGTLKLRQLRQGRPDRRAERAARKKDRVAGQ